MNQRLPWKYKIFKLVAHDLCVNLPKSVQYWLKTKKESVKLIWLTAKSLAIKNSNQISKNANIYKAKKKVVAEKKASFLILYLFFISPKYRYLHLSSFPPPFDKQRYFSNLFQVTQTPTWLKSHLSAINFSYNVVVILLTGSDS